MEDCSGPIYREVISPQFAIESAISAVHFTGKSDFQKVDVIDTLAWGKALVLDGHLQSCEKDEFIYHESLIHPALLAHPNPKRVFVGGGGEGATVREILRHKSVEKVVMVDIDGVCVDVCKKFLSCHHQGIFEDPRAEIIIGDAKAYLENTKDKFDAIILDLSDPLDFGPAKMLYTQSFYTMCMDRLNDDGLLVTQSGPAGYLSHHLVFSAIHKTLGSIFPRVWGYRSFIPSFVDEWGFNVASRNPSLEILVSEEVMNQRIADRLLSPLRYIDAITMQSIFNLTKPIRETIEKEDRLITDDAPLYIP